MNAMPLTPFHLGPTLFFGLLLFSFISLPTFLIANVIADIEPFLVLVLELDAPLHGVSHSFLGASVIAVFLAAVMVRVDKKVQKFMTSIGLKQKPSAKSIWLAAFLGVYSHILFDAPLYTDIKPFFPSSINPFYGIFTTPDAHVIGVILFILGVALYLFKFKKK